MILEDKIKRIKEWQNCSFVHPLTCGNDSSHGLLTPFVDDDKLKLKCPDCEYIQEHIPEVCFDEEFLREQISNFSSWLKNVD